MEEQVNNPLLEAMPPATDYITYLTILEYNLKAENINTLENILQDAELTANIGWDLVHLLLPFLPASEKCLLTIARLGNPREVVLKVTECLRMLDFNPDDHSPAEADDQDHPRPSSPSRPNEAALKMLSEAQNNSLEVLQFNVLLSMLSHLHPRIKTKTPSRFFATSLEAIVATVSRGEVFAEALMPTVLQFMEDLTRFKDPELPDRTTVSIADENQPSQSAMNQAEDVIQKRLIQAFLTHVLEIYMRSLNAPGDVPGLAWAARLYEKVRPKRQIPGRLTYHDMIEANSPLQTRTSMMKRFLSLAKFYRISLDELLHTILQSGQYTVTENDSEDNLPDSADDVPLSTNGSLLLLAALSSTAFLENNEELFPNFNIFPQHAYLVDTFLGDNTSSGINVGGPDTEALLDSILVLGLQALENGHIGPPKDDDAFNRYLQVLSMVSADSQSPCLRYQAHNLVTNVLCSHPSENVRLYFIRDTLEHCPYENLKVSAVSWLKDETVKACSKDVISRNGQTSMFATPVPLTTAAAFMFSDLTNAILSPDDLELWTDFKVNLSFYMSILNFYYLLLTAPGMRSQLNIAHFHIRNDVERRFLQPLRTNCEVFEGLSQDSLIARMEGLDGMRMVQMDLFLLVDVLERVSNAARSL